MSFYNTSPFQMISDLAMIPFGQDVYVISDSKYKELRQKQAAEEIATLENRAEHYDKCAASIRETVAELRNEYDLLPESSDE